MKPLIMIMAGFLTTSVASAADMLARGSDWQVAGRLGLMQFVVISESRAKDRDFYDAITKSLCDPEATSFLRFVTNSKHAPLKVPLPDAILAEPTAMFQRSAKQGNAVFQWACRTGVTATNCF